MVGYPLLEVLKIFRIQDADAKVGLIGGLWLALPHVLPIPEALAHWAHEQDQIALAMLAVGFGCWAVRVVRWGMRHAVKFFMHRALQKRQESEFERLGDDERKVLERFAGSGKGKLALNESDKAVCLLVSKGLLLPGSYQFNELLDARYFTLSHRALKHLEAKRQGGAAVR